MEGSTFTLTLIKVGALLVLFLAVTVVTISMGPVPQDPAYHDFADQRRMLGLPHFWNVVSNAPFLLVGLLGLRYLIGREWRASFVEPWERWVFLVLFAGCALTGIGSAYYHHRPENDTLFLDRLPLTLVFAAFFVAILVDRFPLKFGKTIFLPILAISAGSVIYWYLGERTGHGDLRWYGIVQYFPMAAIPLILLMFTPRYSAAAGLWCVLAAYGFAKLTELWDAQIYELTGRLLSGHTVKHLAAGFGAWLILLTLQQRRPIRPAAEPASASA